MRPSPLRLLRIKPIPASQVQGSIRLPPSQSTPGVSAARPVASKGSARSAAKQATVMRSLLERKDKAQQAGEAFPDNLRLEQHVHKKQLFWKVPAEERQKLAKELKEA